MPKKNQEEMSRKRAEIIMKVRSKEITATEGARQLGISPKTYYKWEQKGLEAMMHALEESSPGRPVRETDPEKESMQKKIQKLEQELETAKKSATVRKLFHAWELQKAKDRDKKENSKKKKR